VVQEFLNQRIPSNKVEWDEDEEAFKGDGQKNKEYPTKGIT
jgi:hypothetical protein